MSARSDAVPLFARPDARAPMLWWRGATLSQAAVLAAIEAHLRQLPRWPLPAGLVHRAAEDTAAHWLNLCLGRQAFMTSFCAVLASGGTNVLASDPAPGTVARLRTAMPGLHVLGDDRSRGDLDHVVDVAPALSAADAMPGAGFLPSAIPTIPGELVAALPFTSGSTGEPMAHPKRFAATRLTALATEARLFADWPRYSVLATVPSQHMYGLETTLMLALCGRALVACEHPLLPADILRTLAALPQPRVLVTTPVHLRALLRATAARGASGLPGVDRVISATAPLAAELAAQVEQRLHCEVHEIYGCTEAGSLATRRTIDGDVWRLLDGYGLAPDDSSLAPGGSSLAPGGSSLAPGGSSLAPGGDANAQSAVVSGPQLAVPVTLPDRIECIDGTRFRLLGRRDDMVNIGGKRASLARLNQQLLQVEGVLDGWIHLPPEAVDGNAAQPRLQGLVVTDGRDERTVLQALAQQMDAVFLPRPLRRVSRIPRNATGKVTLAALNELLRAPAGATTGGDEGGAA